MSFEPLLPVGPLGSQRSSPQAAAEAWSSILEIEPTHAKALRTLRELYATAGEFALTVLWPLILERFSCLLVSDVDDARRVQIAFTAWAPE